MPTRKEIINQVRADQRQRSLVRQSDNRKPAIVGIGKRDPQTGQYEVLLPDGSVEMGEKQFNAALPEGQQVLGIPQESGIWLLDERDVVVARPVEEEPTNRQIKCLFSYLEEGERVFYVGGDRSSPKKIFTLPAAASVREASLTNTGRGTAKWVASIAWQDPGVSGSEPLTRLANIKPSGTTALEAERIHSYLSAYGNGFWSTKLLAVGTFNDFFFGGVYGESTVTTISVAGTILTYTVTTPTLFSGESLNLVNTNPSGIQNTDASGSANNEGLAFWNQALERLSNTSLWLGTDNTIGTVRSGFTDVAHTGSVYLAPAFTRAATTHDYRDSYLEGASFEAAFQTITQQQQYSLWQPFLHGDRLALARQSTINRDFQIYSDNFTTNIISNVNETSDHLYLIDPSGMASDVQLNTALRDLFLYERNGDPTFNLVRAKLWEVDLYNYSNDPDAPDPEEALQQQSLKLPVFKYDLSDGSTEPSSRKVQVLKLKAGNDFILHSASYHPAK